MRDSGEPKLEAELLARSRRSACLTHKSKTLPAILCSSSVPVYTIKVWIRLVHWMLVKINIITRR